ncbi:MAG: hypothetical protein CK533_12990 [Acidobacterium sp.]|nr:hypothetical protein [Acidobacteriota bacterium]PHY08981.1 MAG: hypothetical protein CK533_12990 [Acidobacterium sp.]
MSSSRPRPPARQLNLLRSHAAGVDEPLPVRAVRATMALRANVLAKGYSGIHACTSRWSWSVKVTRGIRVCGARCRRARMTAHRRLISTRSPNGSVMDNLKKRPASLSTDFSLQIQFDKRLATA